MSFPISEIQQIDMS